MDNSILQETITIIRPSQTNDVLNDTKYDITLFESKQGRKVAYFEEKEIIKEVK